jgi:hypothetical protein
MKKITLLVASYFLVGSVAQLTANPVFSNNNDRRAAVVYYEDADPIVFMERGVEFYVFLNGDFDFNTHPQGNQSGYYFRKPGTRTTTVSYTSNYGVKIEQDQMGRVRRVGNTFINYDNKGRVSRIGSVYMKYNAFGLTKVGDLKISYNGRKQIVTMSGTVNMTQGYTTYGNYTAPQNAYYGSSTSYYYRTAGK